MGERDRRAQTHPDAHTSCKGSGELGGREGQTCTDTPRRAHILQGQWRSQSGSTLVNGFFLQLINETKYIYM